jgi:hypothetical protein
VAQPHPIGLAILIGLAATLSACSYSRVISGNSLEYNSGLEQHDNSELIVNILRARDDVPLLFSDLSQIRGSIQTAGSVQATTPLDPLHGLSTRASAQGMLSIQLNPTFDIAPLNTTLFNNAILQPVDLKYIAQLQESAFVPDRVLLNLFIETIEEKGPAGLKIYQNTPLQTMLDFTNELASLTPYSPIGEQGVPVQRRIIFHKIKEITPIGTPVASFSVKDLPNNSGITVATKVINGKTQAYQINDRVVVCLVTEKFLPNYVEIVKREGLDSDDATCNANEIEIEVPRLSSKYIFRTRSIRGMFDYLGHLLRIPVEQRPIDFDISETPGSNPWIAAEYRNQTYYVALPISSDSKTSSDRGHILQIITQLLNSSRNATEIPTTKAVQSVP